MKITNGIQASQRLAAIDLFWNGPEGSLVFDLDDIKNHLQILNKPAYLVQTDRGIALAQEGTISTQVQDKSKKCLGFVDAFLPENLGDASFSKDHKSKYAYYSGAMANGIASEELVIAMGKAGILASFGAAGLEPPKVEKAINSIQSALPEGPYAFNLIHSPSEPLLERKATELFLKNKVQTIEASAFLGLTANLVWYRVAGLEEGKRGEVIPKNRIIAKISRREVAEKFMKPAPSNLLGQLLGEGLITEKQAALAAKVPMADDITVEADSGGHTDNRSLVCLLPSIIELRDEIQKIHQYTTPIRIGAAGGIGVPQSALAAFMMGAGYVVTGSVNQACIEAGTSEHTRKLLGQADFADVMMAPAADMFEMGVKLQVLKRGTLFPLRARKLYDLYVNYNSLEEIPEAERLKIEKQMFHNDVETIWQQTVDYFQQRDPQQITKAEGKPKRKMALVFRWYLGQSSNWANRGTENRKMDYQIWCGPAMGAFNDWVRGTHLEKIENRKTAEVAEEIMNGAAYLYRVRQLQNMGFQLDSSYFSYKPRLPK